MDLAFKIISVIYTFLLFVSILGFFFSKKCRNLFLWLVIFGGVSFYCTIIFGLYDAVEEIKPGLQSEDFKTELEQIVKERQQNDKDTIR